MTGSPATEILRADPVMRRRAMLMLVGGAVVGTASVGWLLPALQRVLLEAKLTGRIRSRTICLAFLGLLVLLAAAVVASGVNVFRLGSRAISSEQFPPPGQKVLRDTPVVRGRRAVALGRVQRILGVLLICCAVALLALSGYAAAVLLF